MKKKILIMTTLVLVLHADFTRDDEKHIVTDSETKLQWQDNLLFIKTWNGAMTHCNNFELGGFNDWRVPNINELISIIDYTNISPSISPVFTAVSSSNYWSSTTPRTSNNDGTLGLTVYFRRGDNGRYGKDLYQYVRCVRGGL